MAVSQTKRKIGIKHRHRRKKTGVTAAEKASKPAGE